MDVASTCARGATLTKWSWRRRCSRKLAVGELVGRSGFHPPTCGRDCPCLPPACGRGPGLRVAPHAPQESTATTAPSSRVELAALVVEPAMLFVGRLLVLERAVAHVLAAQRRRDDQHLLPAHRACRASRIIRPTARVERASFASSRPIGVVSSFLRRRRRRARRAARSRRRSPSSAAARRTGTRRRCRGAATSSAGSRRPAMSAGFPGR